jgi:hypothetical protein
MGGNGSGRPSGSRDLWLNLKLNRIAYGPIGFICDCGGEDFKAIPTLVNVYANKYRRPEFECTGCGLKYIFVGYSAANGTIL